MNKKQTLIWKNEWLQKLDWQSRRHLNCIRFSSNESVKHIKAKVDYILSRMIVNEKGFTVDFLTEIISANRKFRADILILDPELKIPDIIEIAINESEDSIQRKRIFWENQGFNFIEIRNERGE